MILDCKYDYLNAFSLKYKLRKAWVLARKELRKNLGCKYDYLDAYCLKYYDKKGENIGTKGTRYTIESVYMTID